MVQAGRCPFVTRGIAAASFVGRRDEVKLIVRQMESDSPASINVVGDRQMGKSSLLAHVASSYESLVSRGGDRT